MVPGYGPSLHTTPPASLVEALSVAIFHPSAATPHLSLSHSAGSHSTTTPTSIIPITTPTVMEPIAPSYAAFPGCPSIPQKLVQKIVTWEYIDLGSLLPEQLQTAASTAHSSSIVILPESLYETQRRKKRQIPDIATWVQVYSIYMLILASKHPDHLPELIAYQLLIVQHARKFEYPSWLHYDTDFRQWAAANNYRKWSEIHPQFYAYAFTAHSKASAWCPICHTEGGSHTFDCPKFVAPPTSRPNPRPIMYSPPAPFMQRPILPRPPLSNRLGPPPGKRPKPEHCILFNKNNGSCPYGDCCKFAHRCAYCAQTGHPVASCPSKAA